MDDGVFQWDDIKAASNIADHGVAFETARLVFKDPFAIDWLDGRQNYNEERYSIIGMVDGRLLYVAYTMRGEAIRIISARGAESYEHKKYHEDND